MTPAAGVEAGFARRAEALHRQGDGAEALRLLTAGVRRFPGDVTALLVLARVCRERGREEEAHHWFDAALRLDPACPAARTALTDPAAGPTPASSRHARVVTAPAATPPEGEAPSLPPSQAFDTVPVATPVVRPVPRTPATPVPSTFAFPVHEEDEEPEIDENSAPHVATATLAEIYFQQGLKEQAAQIYRQILEQQPGDDAVRKRLEDILREPEGS